MQTKTIHLSHAVFLSSPLALLAAASALNACTADFKTQCPDGTTQTAGGGNIDDDGVCTPNDQLPAGSGGTAGTGGASGASGASGSVPAPVGACQAGQKQCSAEGLSECGADEQWGAPAACEIECDGAKNECVVPVQLAAGDAHACALLSDGTVRCWGDNALGQLGNGSEAGATKPVHVAVVAKATRIVSNTSTTCVTLEDRRALCWGKNSFGSIDAALGEAVKTPTDLGATDIKQISPGGSHICAVTETTSAVQCRGYNFYGQVGNGDSGIQSAGFETAIGIAGSPQQVAAGKLHTCATTSGGTAYCWGYGDRGVTGSATDETFHQAQLLQGVNDATEVYSGDHRACAALKNGAVVCWGSNDFGSLGRGPTFTQTQSNVPSAVANLSEVSKISMSNAPHLCALKNDGTVWCWGSNKKAQLGVGCEQVPCTEGQESASSSPIKSSFTQAIDIATGGFIVSGGFSCALGADHSITCLGGNDNGQLGIGRVSPFELTPQRVVWR